MPPAKESSSKYAITIGFKNNFVKDIIHP